ncbi:MAG TPA: sialidase family protein, partial [Solirubrobacteraceae bacterium]|nr:sialidase family protein [Solirubrobacteraceae bacterium]
DSHDWGATWSAPRTLVSGGASVYPWIAARGSKVAISLYHTSTAGTPDNVPASAQWFETYLESSDAGTTFSAPVSADPTVAKTGPICTEGTGCSANRELGDFQSLTLNNQGIADLTWVRSINNGASTEVRFAHQ